MKPPFLITVNQHPSFPCQLVEKSLWPEECDPKGKCPSEGSCNCYDQKLSALQAGAVVDLSTLPRDFYKKQFALLGGRYKSLRRLKAGVYELDPSLWAVEIRWQFHSYFKKQWIDCHEFFTVGDARSNGNDTRQIAILSPVETPKEEPTRKMAMDEMIEFLESETEEISHHVHKVKMWLYNTVIPKAKSLRQKEIENIKDGVRYGLSIDKMTSNFHIDFEKEYISQTYKI